MNGCTRCGAYDHDLHHCPMPLIGLGVTIRAEMPVVKPKRHRSPNKIPRVAAVRAKRLALKLPETTQAKLITMAAGRKRTQFIVNLIEQEHARRAGQLSPQGTT